MGPEHSRNRLVDVNLNRAAEGLRVVEDICRFHWNLPGFARELKELRHEVLAAGRGGTGRHRDLLRARDSEGDVGRASEVVPSTDDHQDGGGTLPDLAYRNLERAREALRTLEEVSRSIDRKLAATFEAIRFRLYSLEKGIGQLGSDPGDNGRSEMAARLERARLYLLATESLCPGNFPAAVEEAVKAGVDIVQMREVSLPDRALLDRARLLRELTARHQVPLIINDRPDIAILSLADGVHLGQSDLPLREVRSLVGEEKILGVSTHSVEQARKAFTEGADYIGAGPIFETRTKNAGPLLGPRGLEEVLSAISLPVFAIGGIREDNVQEILAGAGSRVALSSAILSSDDVPGTVRRLRELLGS